MGELAKSLIKPGALGLGTAAALGSYYAIKNKGYKDKDGKINKKQALKDLGKAGLAGIGMVGASGLMESLMARNTNKKILGLQRDYDNNFDSYKTIEDRSKAISGIQSKANDLIKRYKRNVKLGYAGLASAGALGIGGKYLLDKKKSKRKEDDGKR